MRKLRKYVSAFVVLILCAETAFASTASTTLKTLIIFNLTDGAYPTGSLAQATDGNFYGTSEYGGANTCFLQYNCGTVFKITRTGSLTTLYNFCDQSNCSDGAVPNGLVQASDGNFYGTSQTGGVFGGTVFKITLKGLLTTLYNFSGGTDGSAPLAGLVQAMNGDFYGTTVSGGANNWGTVFKISAQGKLTTLYSFCAQTNCSDGSGPFAGLIQAIDGNFYGTTYGGGVSDCSPNGCGTIFKITTRGKLTTLYRFCSVSKCPEGSAPSAGLVQATDGNFYGATSRGATRAGAVFKVTPNGKLTVLYAFCTKANCADGAEPTSTLIQGTDGNLYGTTASGGVNNGCGFSLNCGTVFKVTPAGKLTTLYSFCAQSNCSDGFYPYGGLVQATDGTFYGTTGEGGASGNCGDYGCGTVFSLSVGLGPFVITRPTSGEVGTKVVILGTNLIGATGVTFNGTAAQFRVVSKSEIRTTVPNRATSGKVEVKTTRGTLASNVDFRVTK